MLVYQRVYKNRMPFFMGWWPSRNVGDHNSTLDRGVRLQQVHTKDIHIAVEGEGPQTKVELT
jgi:hypothetical protein